MAAEAARGNSNLILMVSGKLGQNRAVPGGQVDEHAVVPGAPRPLGQLLHQLPVVPRTRHAVQAPQARQDGPPVLVRQHRPVQLVALHDGYAAPGAPGGPQGDARPAQPVHIPVDGPGAHLKPLRQTPGGHLPLPEQYGHNTDQPVNRHGKRPPSGIIIPQNSTFFPPL